MDSNIRLQIALEVKVGPHFELVIKDKFEAKIASLTPSQVMSGIWSYITSQIRVELQAKYCSIGVELVIELQVSTIDEVLILLNLLV